MLIDFSKLQLYFKSRKEGRRRQKLLDTTSYFSSLITYGRDMKQPKKTLSCNFRCENLKKKKKISGNNNINREKDIIPNSKLKKKKKKGKKRQLTRTKTVSEKYHSGPKV